MQTNGNRYITRQERYALREKKRRRDRFLLRLIILVVLVAAALALTLSFCGDSKNQQEDSGDTQQEQLQAGTPQTGGDGTQQGEEASGSVGGEEDSPEPSVPVNLGRDFTVCIDPGHGYDDGGASSQYLDDVTEKDLTLFMSLKLQKALEDMGFTVVMTRDSDIVPADMKPNRNGMYIFSAKNRPAVMNATGADVVVSLHCDSYGNESVGGMRVYYYNRNNPEQTPLYAQAVADGMSDIFDGAKVSVTPMGADSAYYVIRDVTMPSILIEAGFVTNPQDAENLQDPQWQRSIAEGIADGIYDYYKSLQEAEGE